MNKLLKSAASVIVFAVASAAAPAQAQFGSGVVVCANCVNEAAQTARDALELAKMADSYLKQIEQYALQIQQYQNMLKNTDLLSGTAFGDALADIRKVQNIIQQTKGLAYTAKDLDAQFRARYGSFKSYLENGMSDADLRDRYQQWSDDTNDAVLTTMKALQSEAETIEDEGDLIAALKSRASTADGQMEALQVGNEMALMGAEQIQKLRALQMMQLQLYARDLQNRSDKEAAELANAIETYTVFDKAPAGKTY